MSIKDVKKNYIIDCATRLFFEKGIAAVTVKDISVRAEVGEATVYRYFLKKENLVIAAAVKLQNEILNKYFTFEKKEVGFDSLKEFYGVFLKVYDEHPEFYRFIDRFDAFIAENPDDLKDYEKAFEKYYSLFLSGYKQGLEDGSVKEREKIDLVYMTTTHSLLELCKKMTSVGKLLEQDVYGREEVVTLIEIILNYLKG